MLSGEKPGRGFKVTVPDEDELDRMFIVVEKDGVKQRLGEIEGASEATIRPI